MACSNCFNGCSEITSDQCVRYTGVEIPVLGIVNGDTLASVENKIINFLLSISTGDTLIPTIDQNDYCSFISSYLPTSGSINLNDILSALIQTTCFIKGKVDDLDSKINLLNANYSINCLTGVTQSSDTHEILQATINKLCAVDTTVDALALDLSTNYVKLSDLNSLIQTYLNSTTPSNLNSNKMVPYIAYEYYGPLTNFDATGSGSGVWDKVYLCNGNNGTPDKRGRVAVGTTDGTMRGGSMSTTVDPTVAGNPSYTIGGTTGSNTVTLTSNQIPSHTHAATTTVTDPGHNHTLSYKKGQADQNESGTSGTLIDLNSPRTLTTNTNSNTTGISVSVAISDTGGGLGHLNIQPTIGAYYIMYIP